MSSLKVNLLFKYFMLEARRLKNLDRVSPEYIGFYSWRRILAEKITVTLSTDLALWNPLMSRPMWGVTTQYYALKSNADWMTDLKKKPETRSLAPSLISILDIPHIVSDFTRFRTNVSHSSSATDSTLPRYL